MPTTAQQKKRITRRSLLGFGTLGAISIAVSQKADALVIENDGKARVKVKSMYSKHWPLRAEVNLRTQQFKLFEYGKEIYSWKISSGKKGYGTPQGTYSPKWLHKYHRSNKYESAPMPHAVFFYGGYAVHGTPWTHKLGTPASKGCVRLHEAAAKEFFKLVREHGMKNTRINISYPPASASKTSARKFYKRSAPKYVIDKVQKVGLKPLQKPSY